MAFGRKVDVSVVFGAYVNSFSEKFKIDFDITQSTGGTYSSGSVTITGLPTEDLIRMATYYNFQNRILMPNAVTITAGYGWSFNDFTPKYATIFSGAAMSAELSLDTPDKSITFELSSAYYQNEALKVDYTAPVSQPLPAVISAVVTPLGFVPNVDATLSARIVKSFKYTGQLSGFIEKLRSMYDDLEFYTEKNMFCVTLKNEPNLVGAVLPVTIRSEELLGTPAPTFVGCNIKTLLKPTIAPKQLIMVESKRFANTTIGTTMDYLLSGEVFVAMNVRHQGSTRDSAYFTEIECVRRSLWGSV